VPSAADTIHSRATSVVASTAISAPINMSATKGRNHIWRQCPALPLCRTAADRPTTPRGWLRVVSNGQQSISNRQSRLQSCHIPQPRESQRFGRVPSLPLDPRMECTDAHPPIEVPCPAFWRWAEAPAMPAPRLPWTSLQLMGIWAMSDVPAWDGCRVWVGPIRSDGWPCCRWAQITTEEADAWLSRQKSR
jgi:hypothetical protein